MNCKPGDMAIMIRALGSEQGTGANIGRLCNVLDAVGVRDTTLGPLFYWHVEMVGSPGRDSHRRLVRTGEFPDKYLRPFRLGEKADSTERTKELIA